jgi:uncharacterized RDD family membrane protein YckC
MKKNIWVLGLVSGIILPAFVFGQSEMINSFNEYLSSQQNPEFESIMVTVGTVMLVLFYVILPIPTLVLLFKSVRQNWTAKKSKEKSVGYAGFWKRVAIKTIDKLLSIFLVPIVLNVFFYFRDGQTIGDKILGGKIIDQKTHEIASVGKLFVRFFAKFFSTISLGVGYWPAGWRAEKNAWHDSLSETRYISTKRTSGGWIVLTVGAGTALLIIFGTWSFWLPRLLQS